MVATSLIYPGSPDRSCSRLEQRLVPTTSTRGRLSRAAPPRPRGIARVAIAVSPGATRGRLGPAVERRLARCPAARAVAARALTARAVAARALTARAVAAR